MHHLTITSDDMPSTDAPYEGPYKGETEGDSEPESGDGSGPSPPQSTVANRSTDDLDEEDGDPMECSHESNVQVAAHHRGRRSKKKVPVARECLYCIE